MKGRHPCFIVAKKKPLKSNDSSNHVIWPEYIIAVSKTISCYFSCTGSETSDQQPSTLHTSLSRPLYSPVIPLPSPLSAPPHPHSPSVTSPVPSLIPSPVPSPVSTLEFPVPSPVPSSDHSEDDNPLTSDESDDYYEIPIERPPSRPMVNFADDTENEDDYEIGWEWYKVDPGPIIASYNGFRQCLLDPTTNKPEHFFNALFQSSVHYNGQGD